MLIKTLRRLVPEEIKALLEKIDSLETTTDSSSYLTKEFMRYAKLTRLERYLLRDAMYRIERRDTMVRAMNIVIGNHNTESYVFAGSNGTEAMRIDATGNISVEAHNIYRAAEQARQAALAQENLARKKVTVRVKPAAQ